MKFNNIKLLLKEIFFGKYNVNDMDFEPCYLCGKITQADYIIVKGKKRFLRDNRVDCEIGGKKKPLLVTYHKDCWKKIVFSNNTNGPTLKEIYDGKTKTY